MGVTPQNVIRRQHAFGAKMTLRLVFNLIRCGTLPIRIRIIVSVCIGDYLLGKSLRPTVHPNVESRCREQAPAAYRGL